MKVIVAGGRDFTPTNEHVDFIVSKLTELKATEIVCGMAKGADEFGLKTAITMNLNVSKFPAN